MESYLGLAAFAAHVAETHVEEHKQLDELVQAIARSLELAGLQ
jgi:hypothetical protein